MENSVNIKVIKGEGWYKHLEGKYLRVFEMYGSNPTEYRTEYNSTVDYIKIDHCEIILEHMYWTVKSPRCLPETWESVHKTKWEIIQNWFKQVSITTIESLDANTYYYLNFEMGLCISNKLPNNRHEISIDMLYKYIKDNEKINKKTDTQRKTIYASDIIKGRGINKVYILPNKFYITNPNYFILPTAEKITKFEYCIDFLSKLNNKAFDGIEKYYSNDGLLDENDISSYEHIQIDELYEIISNTQLIFKNNLSEIYNCACENWKNKITEMTLRNPFGNYVLLSNSEVSNMFKASDEKQKEILSKYLHIQQVINFENVEGKITLNNNIIIIACNKGQYSDKAFVLNDKYKWSIELCDKGYEYLIPKLK